jgi:cytochrome c oxidase assembly factor CtaG
MTNTTKAMLIFIGALFYISFPPLFFDFSYMESVAAWTDEAVILYLALLIVISLIMKSEQEKEDE